MPITSHQVLTASDGHTLSAFQAEPDAPSLTGFPTQAGQRAKGGLVIVQEIFGVNHHIRALCEQFAVQGYFAIAPALFDRVKPDVELDYSEASIGVGRELRGRIAWQDAVHDVAAAMGLAAAYGGVGVIGYCWGGSVAWLTATRAYPACAVCYYGGQIAQFKDERPNCPVLMHFGERDQAIPLSDVEAIRQAQPGVEIHVYPGAAHGFNCSERSSFDPASARLAFDRTLAFLEAHLKLPAF